MLSPLEEKLLGLMILVLMLGMGSTLTMHDFRLVLKHPRAVLIGFVSQFAVMPLLAFSLGYFLQLPVEAAVSLVLIGCTPGGTTSNMFAYFSKGDVALSISMTVASTFAAVLVMPILIAVYTSGVAGDEYSIPYVNIVKTLVAVIVPVLIGMVIKKKSLKVARIIEKIGSWSGIVIIIFLIVTWVPQNGKLLSATTYQAYFAVLGLGLFGFFFGYVVSSRLGLDARRSRTVALETGIQNTPLTIGIIVSSFAATMQPKMLHLPLLYALGIVITSSLVTILFRRMAAAEKTAQ